MTGEVPPRAAAGATWDAMPEQGSSREGAEEDRRSPEACSVFLAQPGRSAPPRLSDINQPQVPLELKEADRSAMAGNSFGTKEGKGWEGGKPQANHRTPL